MLTAAGALRNVVLLLRGAGLPDCVAAYVAAASEAGFQTKAGPLDAGQISSALLDGPFDLAICFTLGCIECTGRIAGKECSALR